MKTTIKVQRFAVGGMVLVAELTMAPADRDTERRAAKEALDNAYFQQDGFAPLCVLLDGIVIDYLGVRSTEHLNELYAAVRAA